MADLKETDEEVGKAGMLPSGGSQRHAKRAKLRLRAEGAATRFLRQGIGETARKLSSSLTRRAGAQVYLERRGAGRTPPQVAARRRTFRIVKSNEADPISTLYAEIEKARSAFSGGSSKAFNRVGASA